MAWDVWERDVEAAASNKLEWEAEDRELESVVWELGAEGWELGAEDCVLDAEDCELDCDDWDDCELEEDDALVKSERTNVVSRRFEGPAVS